MCQSHFEHVTPSPNAFIGNINCSMTFEHKLAKNGIRHSIIIAPFETKTKVQDNIESHKSHLLSKRNRMRGKTPGSMTTPSMKTCFLTCSDCDK